MIIEILLEKINKNTSKERLPIYKGTTNIKPNMALFVVNEKITRINKAYNQNSLVHTKQ